MQICRWHWTCWYLQTHWVVTCPSINLNQNKQSACTLTNARDWEKDAHLYWDLFCLRLVVAGMCNPCTEVYMHHNHEDSTFPAKPRGNPSALFLTPAPRTRLNNGDSRGSTSRPVSLIHCLFVHIKLWCHTINLPPKPPLSLSTPPPHLSLFTVGIL